MWIRSQDKKGLVDIAGKGLGILKRANKSADINIDLGTDGVIEIGNYSSEERAIEVLEDIQQHIETSEYLKVRPEAWDGENFTYQMPAE